MNRPKTRGECRDGPRPCPWVGCRHHLYLEVSAVGGIRVNYYKGGEVHGRPVKVAREPWELPVSCSLDVAERANGRTLEEVGQILEITRERVRQIEKQALKHMLKNRVAIAKLAPHVDGRKPVPWAERKVPVSDEPEEDADE